MKKTNKLKISEKEWFPKKYNGDFEKTLINNTLAELYNSLHIKSDMAIVLDAEDIFTTKTLIKKTELKKFNIHISNPFSYKKIYQQHKQTANYVLNKFMDIVKVPFKNRITFAFLDFMGTLSGNKTLGICPKKDITKYFKYKLPAKESLFAVTISLRNRNAGKTNDIVKLKNHIKKVAKENKYKVISLPLDFTYRKSMYILAYYICKI